MPITLYVETSSDDLSFSATSNPKLIEKNLLVMGFSPGNRAPAFFAAGRYICMLENHVNQVDMCMYFYEPPVNLEKADSLLGSLSSDLHKDLFMDAYNEINSETYKLKEKYTLEFAKNEETL